MDRELGRLVSLHTPKLNPAIAGGLAVIHMKEVESYVDQVFKSASKGFPPGLVYVGCKRCTEQEEFMETTKKKGPRRQFDVARSDIYMMKYFFRWNGEDLPPRYLSLPFVSDGGFITLGGSRFNISPLLSDRVISVGVSNIFVRLLRDRLTFERMTQHFQINGRRETVQVAWGMIYHKNAKQKKIRPTIKANCSLMHYLLCKYGFRDTFLKFGHCEPIIGGQDRVNRNTYPEEEGWVICSSEQAKPKGCGRGFYQPTYIQIAVRKEDLTPMVKNMIGGFFYIADHFPSRIQPEYIGIENERRLWCILLGHILFSSTIQEGKLYDDIYDHLTSLDEYIDGLVSVKLKDIGIEVEDIYKLFAIVIENFNEWLLSATNKVASMYDKELSILYYVLFDVTSAIFKLYFKLKAASKKELTAKEIISTFNMTLRSGLIFSLTKNHGEVSTVSSPGDNKAFKITSLLVPQTGSSRASSRKDRQVLDNPAQRLHESVAEVGGYSNLPKAEPSGRSRLNPMVQFNEKSVIVRNPERMELLDRVGDMIRR